MVAGVTFQYLEPFTVASFRKGIAEYVSKVRTILPDYNLTGRRFGGKIGGSKPQHPPILGAGFGCLTETWVELGSTSLDPSNRVKKGKDVKFSFFFFNPFKLLFADLEFDSESKLPTIFPQLCLSG